MTTKLRSAATPVAVSVSVTVTVTSFAASPGSGRQTAAQTVSFRSGAASVSGLLLVTVTVQFLPSTPKSCIVGKRISSVVRYLPSLSVSALPV